MALIFVSICKFKVARSGFIRGHMAKDLYVGRMYKVEEEKANAEDLSRLLGLLGSRLGADQRVLEL
jgi:hypothetical protein